MQKNSRLLPWVFALSAVCAQFTHADVDLRTGSFTDSVVDFKISESPQVFFTRTYYSHAKTMGTMGAGWATSFDIRLSYSEPGFLQVLTTDGTRVYVPKNQLELLGANARIGLMTQSIADIAKRDQVIHLLLAGDKTYDLQWSSYLLSSVKPLKTISSTKVQEFVGVTAQDGVFKVESDRLVWLLPSGEQRVFSMDGKLTEIKNSVGKIAIQYSKDRVAKIDVLSPEKTEFVFEYTGPVLTQVTRKGANSPVAEYAYDKENRIIRVTDALKNKTQYEYETAKGATLLTKVIGIGGTQQTISYVKNGDGYRVQSAKLGVGLEAKFNYDSKQIKSGTYVTNVVRTVRLPGKGAKEINERHEWLTNRSRSKDIYVFKETHQTGKAKIEIFRNEMGLPILEKTPISKTLYQYDAIGRLTTKITADEVAHFKYGVNGDLSEIVGVYPKHPEKNMKADLAYDAQGRMKGFKTADGIDAQFARDSSGRVTSMQDKASKVKLDIRYDEASRIQSVSSDQYGIFKFNYDSNGQMKSLIAPENKQHLERLNTWWSRFDSVLRLSQRGGI